MRTGLRLGHLSQSHRRIRSGSQAQVNLKRHELSILDHCWGIESEELVLVRLGEGNVWVRVPQNGP